MKSGNDNFEKDPGVVGIEVPKGFEPRFQILRRTSNLGTAGAGTLFDRVENLLQEQEVFQVSDILHCQHEKLVEDPAANFIGVAKKRFEMLPEEIRSQVINACKLRDFDFVRRRLRVSELFDESEYYWIDI